MAKSMYYPVKIEPAIVGGYCVFFQNSIGGATQGETIGEALYMAKDYLLVYFADIFYNNEISPEPEEFPGFTHFIEFTVLDWFTVFNDSHDLSFERIDITKMSDEELDNFLEGK